MATELWIFLCLGFFTKYAISLDHSVQYIGPDLVSEGDPLTLSCVTPFQDTSSSWTLNGSILITDENLLGFELVERRLYSVYKEMILRTVSAQLYQTGEYRCNDNSRDFHFVRIVEDAETVVEVATASPTNKHKRAGDGRYPKRYYWDLDVDYEFLCETDVEDYPVLWYRNMEPIDAFTAPNLELYDRSLIIHNAQLEDIGEYTCRLDAAFQPGKRDVISRYLLTSPALIEDISGKQNIIRGRTMTVYCKAKGYPAPKITWYIGNLNAYILKEKDLRISVYSKREKFSNAYLTVRNMTNFDRGLYTCRAENGIVLPKERKYHEMSIPVYVRDNIIEPNEDKPGLGKVLVPGEPLILQCKTEECPYCSIVWFKEGEKLSPHENYLNIDELNNSLTIRSPTVNDTGLYECAVNREMLNVDLRATIKVQVCDDLLSAGFTIETVCEMPFVVESTATATLHKNSVSSLLFFVVFSYFMQNKELVIKL